MIQIFLTDFLPEQESHSNLTSCDSVAPCDVAPVSPFQSASVVSKPNTRKYAARVASSSISLHWQMVVFFDIVCLKSALTTFLRMNLFSPKSNSLGLSSSSIFVSKPFLNFMMFLPIINFTVGNVMQNRFCYQAGRLMNLWKPPLLSSFLSWCHICWLAVSANRFNRFGHVFIYKCSIYWYIIVSFMHILHITDICVYAMTTWNDIMNGYDWYAVEDAHLRFACKLSRTKGRPKDQQIRKTSLISGRLTSPDPSSSMVLKAVAHSDNRPAQHTWLKEKRTWYMVALGLAWLLQLLLIWKIEVLENLASHWSWVSWRVPWFGANIPPAFNLFTPKTSNQSSGKTEWIIQSFMQTGGYCSTGWREDRESFVSISSWIWKSRCWLANCKALSTKAPATWFLLPLQCLRFSTGLDGFGRIQQNDKSFEACDYIENLVPKKWDSESVTKPNKLKDMTEEVVEQHQNVPRARLRAWWMPHTRVEEQGKSSKHLRKNKWMQIISLSSSFVSCVFLNAPSAGHAKIARIRNRKHDNKPHSYLQIHSNCSSYPFLAVSCYIYINTIKYMYVSLSLSLAHACSVPSSLFWIPFASLYIPCFQTPQWNLIPSSQESHQSPLAHLKPLPSWCHQA